MKLKHSIAKQSIGATHSLTHSLLPSSVPLVWHLNCSKSSAEGGPQGGRVVLTWYRMLCCSSLNTHLRDYDKLQSFAVILLYIQVGCSLVGSLGAIYNGVLLINLAIALFALVAIESGSQSLGRTYAFLLLSSILIDVIWFILFSPSIWNISEEYGAFFVFSLKLMLVMQIIGLSIRVLSSLLWIQMYRLGASHVESGVPREADFDLRSSFLSPPTPALGGQSSDAADPLGGSIYDPAYFSSLFEVIQDDGFSLEGKNNGSKNGESSSQSESCKLRLSVGNAFQEMMMVTYLTAFTYIKVGIGSRVNHH